MILCTGCATTPGGGHNPDRLALRSIPEVPDGHLRADQAMVGALFAANGVHLTAEQLEQLIPSGAPQGRINRHALQDIAGKYQRRLLVLKAGPAHLGTELANNHPLLVLLPPDTRYSAAAAALIVIAWDRQTRTLDLLDGNGEIQTLPEADFFTRREPLKHAALCLSRPGAFPRSEPAREQKLLLADFWYDQTGYRRPAPRLDSYPALVTRDKSVESLVDSGKALFRRQRYKESIPVFRAALAKEPDNPVVLNYLAYAMLNGNGELLTALRHANKANRLDANNPVVLETLGCINLRLGDAQTAVQHLEHAWARALHRPPEMQVAIMDQLVRAWLAADRQDLARQVAEYRVRTYPEYALPKDILLNFPALRRARFLSSKNIPVVGG